MTRTLAAVAFLLLLPLPSCATGDEFTRQDLADLARDVESVIVLAESQYPELAEQAYVQAAREIVVAIAEMAESGEAFEPVDAAELLDALPAAARAAVVAAGRSDSDGAAAQALAEIIVRRLRRLIERAAETPPA